MTVLIRAVALLKNKISFKLDFIGDGESREELEKLAVGLGVEGNCFFHGAKSRQFIYENLKYYDLFVQPSRFEGFGLTVAEAIAARLPVLVSDIEGPMEIIENGKYGFFFRSEDPQSCSEQILKIYNSYADMESYTAIALSASSCKFDISETCMVYLRAYGSSLMGDNRSYQGGW